MTRFPKSTLVKEACEIEASRCSEEVVKFVYVSKTLRFSVFFLREEGGLMSQVVEKILGLEKNEKKKKKEIKCS